PIIVIFFSLAETVSAGIFGQKTAARAAVGSKLNDVVERAALRTTGTFDVAVVGVNETAFFATENVVFARCRLETPPTMFGIYCRGGKCRKQNHHVSKNE